MKKIFILTLIIISFTKVFSQDKIITLKGDTITCSIQKLEDNIIYFQTNNNGLTENKTISNEKVAYFMYANIPTYNELESYDTVKSNVRINLKIGNTKFIKSSNVSMLESEHNVFSEKTNSGLLITGQLDFFMTNKLTFGVQYNYNAIKNDLSFDNLEVSLDKITKNKAIKIKDKQQTHFIASIMTYNKRLYQTKHYLSFSAAVGWLIYSNKADVYIPTPESADLKTETVGFIFGAAYEYKINKYFGTGIDFSYLYSNFGEYNLNGKKVKLKNKLSLSSYDLSVGFKFYI